MEKELLFPDNFSVEMTYYNHRLPTLNWEITEDLTKFTDVTYVLDGEAVYYINGTPYTVHAGDLLCIPSGSVRKAHTFSDRLIESQCMNFLIHTFDGSSLSLPFPLITKIGHHPELAPFFHEIQKAWLSREPGYKFHVQAYLMLILERLYQIIIYSDSGKVDDPRIMKVINYITSHYSQPLSLKDAAAHVHLSPMYFGNLFKQQTGMTFRQYLTSVRLNQAENMLLSGEYNVSEAAALCGFSDIFYFSKTYKKEKGVSPSNVNPHKSPRQ